MARQTSGTPNVKVPAWNNDAFSDRLKQAIGDRTPYSIEKETGIAQSLIRKYLSGASIPGADKLVILASISGVSIGWLATGEEQEGKGQTLDFDALEEVAIKVLEIVERNRPELSAQARGRIVRLVFEFYIRQEKPMDEASLSNVIELAAFR